MVDKIDLPEGFTEDGAGDDEDADGDDTERKARNELIYIAGRVYRSENKWIFEQFHHVTTTEQFPDIAKSLGDLLMRAKKESSDYETKMAAAKEKILRA